MKVKIVSQLGKSVVVEWVDDGMPRRCVLPASSVATEYVSEEELLRGVDVGVPWDEIELKATSRDLCAALRNCGIWTIEDLRSKPDVVVGVLQALYRVDYQTLLRKFGGK